MENQNNHDLQENSALSGIDYSESKSTTALEETTDAIELDEPGSSLSLELDLRPGIDEISDAQNLSGRNLPSVPEVAESLTCQAIRSDATTSCPSQESDGTISSPICKMSDQDSKPAIVGSSIFYFLTKL